MLLPLPPPEESRLRLLQSGWASAQEVCAQEVCAQGLLWRLSPVAASSHKVITVSGNEASPASPAQYPSTGRGHLGSGRRTWEQLPVVVLRPLKSKNLNQLLPHFRDAN